MLHQRLHRFCKVESAQRLRVQVGRSSWRPCFNSCHCWQTWYLSNLLHQQILQNLEIYLNERVSCGILTLNNEFLVFLFIELEWYLNNLFMLTLYFILGFTWLIVPKNLIIFPKSHVSSCVAGRWNQRNLFFPIGSIFACLSESPTVAVINFLRVSWAPILDENFSNKGSKLWLCK